MGHSTSSGRFGGASAPQREVNTTEMISRAQDAIAGIKARASNSVTFERPDNGHEILVTINRVNPRDYWGRRVAGPATYTVRVDDTTSGDRLWYDYGVESLSRVKADIYRVTGVSQGRRR